VRNNPLPQNLSAKFILESLLFVSADPVAVSHLADVLELPVEEVEAALRDLEVDYSDRGFRLQRHRDKVQLVTAPEVALHVERFLELDMSSKLSAAALETLGIIAYRQPVTRAQIEAVRGVGCDGVLRTLLGHGLVEEGGRLEQAGRPILYCTTFQFLQHFGLTGYDQLPPLEDMKEEDETGSSDEQDRNKRIDFLKR
jgi:segregation and condensation protein B